MDLDEADKAAQRAMRKILYSLTLPLMAISIILIALTPSEPSLINPGLGVGAGAVICIVIVELTMKVCLWIWLRDTPPRRGGVTGEGAHRVN